MRFFLLSAGLFAFILGGLALGGYIYMIEPGPEGRLRYVLTGGKLLLHKYSVLDSLSPEEAKRLYQDSCVGKCHSRDVVEKTPRTAGEWEWIVSRMKIPDRADLTEPEAKSIAEYLQKNYLSNVPTVLPEETMRFLKKHLWRMDFGESDLYFDIIFIPRQDRNLMPYLAFRSIPRDSDDSLFIVYMNTHSGLIPHWNLGQMTTLTDTQGNEMKAAGWEVLYEDTQQHHRQGILTFPRIPGSGATLRGAMELTIHPPGMRKRIFRWNLPIPFVGGRPVGANTGEKVEPVPAAN